jgi:hypothetical protein
MALPATPSRPRRGPRRTAADLLLGLLAVTVLLALTVGVPYALVTVFGLPVPHTLPRLSVLSRPLDVFGILKVLSVAVWLAWIQLVWCVIAEVRAAVRNAGLPARVPLAGGTQALVHRLVSTALLLFAATSALSPALGIHGPAGAVPRAAATAAPRPAASGAAASGAAASGAAASGAAASGGVASGGVASGAAASGAAASGAAASGAAASGGAASSPAAPRPAASPPAAPGPAPAGGRHASGARPPQLIGPPQVAQASGAGAPGRTARGTPPAALPATPRGAHPAVPRPAPSGTRGATPTVTPPATPRATASATPAVSPRAAPATTPHRAPGAPGASPRATAPGGPGMAPNLPGPPPDGLQPGTEKIYVVQPPAGRFHESLWEIAQRFLGDGRRYREIFALNAGRVQPDGSQLTIASLIRPGWQLRLPADAHGPGLQNGSIPAAPRASLAAPAGLHDQDRTGGQHYGADHRNRPQAGESGADRDRAPGGERAGEHARRDGRDGAARRDRRDGHRDAAAGETAAARLTVARPGAARPRPADRAMAAGPAGGRQPAAGPAVARAARTTVAGATGTAVARAAAARAAGPAATGLGYPRELAAASLLAAGLLAALGRRRREQWWQRAFGHRIAAPAGGGALVEAALRSGAAEPVARLLDTSLRSLSSSLARSGQAPPAVFAAHLSPANLDLWIGPADRHAPPPWTAVGDGQVWRLPAAALDRTVSAAGDDGPALFPGLVSLGTDGGGRVLVDLEAAHGVIAVTGPPGMVTAVLSGVALELATSRWSDGMRLTLAGFGADLVPLAPDRLTAVATLDDALPGLEEQAAAVTGALADAGIGSVLTGRASGIDPDAWTPHYLISAVPPTPRQSARLVALARSSQAAAASYLVAGDVPGAAWSWEVSPDGRLVAAELGLDVQAQLVPDWQRQAVADLFEVAARTEGVPLSVTAADTVPREHLDQGSPAPVEIVLLGPVRVDAPGPVPPGAAELLTEVLAYLAVHPGGVDRATLGAAIWPGGIDPGDRDAVLDQAAEWLGADRIGRPQLAEDATGRLRLGSGVRVDWQVFQALTGRAADEAEGSLAVAGHLAQALDLVCGPFLDGRGPAGYAWLVAEGLEHEVAARVADAAHRLAELRRAAGDSEGALAAAESGLRLAAEDQLLWRDLIQAAQATGQWDRLHAALGAQATGRWDRPDAAGGPAGLPGLAPGAATAARAVSATGQDRGALGAVSSQHPVTWKSPDDGSGSP